MKDLRFDWYPSLTCPQIEERLGVLLEELLKDYKAGSGIKPKSSYEVSSSAISNHLLSALYCAYHAGERVSLVDALKLEYRGYVIAVVEQ